MEHSLFQNFAWGGLTKHQEERKSKIIFRVEHSLLQNFIRIRFKWGGVGGFFVKIKYQEERKSKIIFRVEHSLLQNLV